MWSKQEARIKRRGTRWDLMGRPEQQDPAPKLYRDNRIEGRPLKPQAIFVILECHQCHRCSTAHAPEGEWYRTRGLGEGCHRDSKETPKQHYVKYRGYPEGEEKRVEWFDKAGSEVDGEGGSQGDGVEADQGGVIQQSEKGW